MGTPASPGTGPPAGFRPGYGGRDRSSPARSPGVHDERGGPPSLRPPMGPPSRRFTPLASAEPSPLPPLPPHPPPSHHPPHQAHRGGGGSDDGEVEIEVADMDVEEGACPEPEARHDQRPPHSHERPPLPPGPPPPSSGQSLQQQGTGAAYHDAAYYDHFDGYGGVAPPPPPPLHELASPPPPPPPTEPPPPPPAPPPWAPVAWSAAQEEALRSCCIAEVQRLAKLYGEASKPAPWQAAHSQRSNPLSLALYWMSEEAAGEFAEGELGRQDPDDVVATPLPIPQPYGPGGGGREGGEDDEEGTPAPENLEPLPLTDECRIIPWEPDPYRPPVDLRAKPPDPTASPRAVAAPLGPGEPPAPLLYLVDFPSDDRAWQPWHLVAAPQGGATGAAASSVSLAGTAGSTAGGGSYGLAYSAVGLGGGSGVRSGRDLQQPEDGLFRYPRHVVNGQDGSLLCTVHKAASLMELRARAREGGSGLPLMGCSVQRLADRLWLPLTESLHSASRTSSDAAVAASALEARGKGGAAGPSAVGLADVPSASVGASRRLWGPSPPPHMLAEIRYALYEDAHKQLPSKVLRQLIQEVLDSREGRAAAADASCAAAPAGEPPSQPQPRQAGLDAAELPTREAGKAQQVEPAPGLYGSPVAASQPKPSPAALASAMAADRACGGPVARTGVCSEAAAMDAVRAAAAFLDAAGGTDPAVATDPPATADAADTVPASGSAEAAYPGEQPSAPPAAMEAPPAAAAAVLGGELPDGGSSGGALRSREGSAGPMGPAAPSVRGAGETGDGEAAAAEAENRRLMRIAEKAAAKRLKDVEAIYAIWIGKAVNLMKVGLDEVFLDDPCKVLGDYAAVVPQPMWFKRIQKQQRKYSHNEGGLRQLEADFELIGENAVAYNGQVLEELRRQRERLAGRGGPEGAGKGEELQRLAEEEQVHRAVLAAGQELRQRAAEVFADVRRQVAAEVLGLDSAQRVGR
ncbi:hypothetical protein GPECTOR_11g338 [Gonium pectorale]|uniref:Bromo domain-containing protein n=1 Tax=Gonium pectorale TaxID=33097 RepID=A0A150GQ25_GONPE|nr:hypothetical protein GPECTOR_11g338 [Gonium pectorale]|eukprot:KXZ51904.1 hypothetical protein GPECTOR_11g338 [Gonium pectorale]